MIRDLTTEELRELYERELIETFPSAELKPLKAMESLIRRGCYRPLALFEAGEVVSYMMLWSDRSGQYALIDYLGTVQGRRNSGYGAKLLEKAVAACPEVKCFLGEVEAANAEDPAENALRQRRLAFYERNGFRRLNYDCALFGVHYNCIAYGDGSDAEALKGHQAVYTEHFPPVHLARYIQIPLAPGEAVKPYTPWKEV